MTLPSISIITPCFNAQETIACCRQSVLSQSLEVQHVVIDGASRDRTLGRLNEIEPAPQRVISEPDDGIYHAMNKGILHSDGEVVGILNADDLYADREVLADVARIFADPAVDSCYGDLVYVDAARTDRVRRFWKSGEYHCSRFYWGWMPPHPTFFVRRSVYQRFGLFDLSLGSAADYELMLRFLVKHRISSRYLPRVLVRMRVGGESNASLKNRLRANRMDRLAWKSNDLQPYPWTTLVKPLRKVGQFLVHG